MTARETLAALTAQVRCDLEQHHPDTDVTDETISLVLELGGPRMKAAVLREESRWLWRQVFLCLPNTPSPLSDRVQRHVMDLTARANRIEAGD